MPKVGHHWSFPQESTGWVVLKPPRMSRTQTAQIRSDCWYDKEKNVAKPRTWGQPGCIKMENQPILRCCPYSNLGISLALITWGWIHPKSVFTKIWMNFILRFQIMSDCSHFALAWFIWSRCVSQLFSGLCWCLCHISQKASKPLEKREQFFLWPLDRVYHSDVTDVAVVIVEHQKHESVGNYPHGYHGGIEYPPLEIPPRNYKIHIWKPC